MKAKHRNALSWLPLGPKTPGDYEDQRNGAHHIMLHLIISCHISSYHFSSHHATSHHARWHSVYLSSFLLRHTHSSSIVCLLSSVLHSTPILHLSTLDIVLCRSTSHEITDFPRSWLHNYCINGLAFICMNVFDHLLICMNAIHDLNFNHSFSWQICYTYLQYFLSIELMFLVDE